MVVLTAVLTALIATQNDASACSPPIEADPYAIPITGAVDVPTATSILVVSDYYPPWVEVTANGEPLRFDGLEGHLHLVDGGQLWTLRGVDMLEPNTEYVVTFGGQEPDSRTELTRFTTGDGYDKISGTPPVLKSLALWRVRYGVDEIGAGGCVSSEYHGAIAVDYSEASVPGTPPEATRYTLNLFAKNGGYYEGTSFLGDWLFKGETPEGENPFPQSWPPAPDPTQEYCAKLVVEGYGDLARPPLESNTLCAKVTEIDTTGGRGGAGADDTDAGESDGGVSDKSTGESGGSGCSVVGVGF
ncbi:MAG: hypothetical protein HY897_05095 [Deltaproteobacteria bacterium]|nr:hypothetical protein [Deltaproteobacteria bacterium]